MNILPKNPGKTLMEIAYIVIVFLAIYFVLPKVFMYALPFIFGYIISKIINPISDFMQEKLKLPKRLSIITVLLLIVGIMCYLIFVLFYEAVYEIQKLAYIVPAVLEGDIDLPSWMEHIKVFFFSLPESVQEFFIMVANSLKSNISSIVRPATQAVISAATKVAGVMPNIIVFVVVMILSAYFICSDRYAIREFLKNTVPKNLVRRILYVKAELVRACGGYLKAQGILMFVTFIVMLVGLSVLGVEATVLISAIVAVVDAVPILGTGTILGPWAIVSLISGKYFLALGLIIIYAISFLVRRVAEPKIVSEQIGLHPLITLIAIYVGLRAMGVFGMILGPIFAIIVINFIKAEQKYKQEIENA